MPFVGQGISSGQIVVEFLPICSRVGVVTNRPSWWSHKRGLQPHIFRGKSAPITDHCKNTPLFFGARFQGNLPSERKTDIANSHRLKCKCVCSLDRSRLLVPNRFGSVSVSLGLPTWRNITNQKTKERACKFFCKGLLPSNLLPPPKLRKCSFFQKRMWAAMTNFPMRGIAAIVSPLQGNGSPKKTVNRRDLPILDAWLIVCVYVF